MRGCEGVDYELGDLRVVENKIAYSGKGNRKMTGSVLVGLGGGKARRGLWRLVDI
jgi:hypothetical protein